MRSTSSIARLLDAATAHSLRACAALGLAVFVLLATVHAAGWLEAGHIVQALPDLCLFHRVTGHDCPGCGMGRSLAALAAGAPRAALSAHPLGPALLAMAAFVVAAPVGWRARASAANWAWKAILAGVTVWWLVARVAPFV